MEISFTTHFRSSVPVTQLGWQLSRSQLLTLNRRWCALSLNLFLPQLPIHLLFSGPRSDLYKTFSSHHFLEFFIFNETEFNTRSRTFQYVFVFVFGALQSGCKQKSAGLVWQLPRSDTADGNYLQDPFKEKGSMFPHSLGIITHLMWNIVDLYEILLLLTQYPETDNKVSLFLGLLLDQLRSALIISQAYTTVSIVRFSPVGLSRATLEMGGIFSCTRLKRCIDAR